jgi:hypothetical protein
VLDRFLTYARSKPGVWFARKDEIADWALKQREITPIYDRGDPTVTGLPGSAVQGRPTDAREELRGFQKERITNV